MPTVTIPLIGAYTQRNINARTQMLAGKDARYISCFFETATDQIKGETTIYVCKRPGFGNSATIGSAVGQAISDDGNIMIFGSTGGTVFYVTTNCGTLTSGDYCGYIRKIRLGAEVYYLISGSNTLYYLPVLATGFSTTFTGDTHTNTTIDNVSSLNGLYVGQLITGTGIQAGTRIAAITAPSTITTTIATTATNATVTITRTHLAKIIDADFPTDLADPGGALEMDGYILVMGIGSDGTKRLYQSNLNSISSYTAQNYLPITKKADDGIGIMRYKDSIMCFGSTSIEFAKNTGNPSGSVFSTIDDSFINFGSAGAGGDGIAFFKSAYAELGEIIVWKGGGLGRFPGVWMLSGGTPQKISTPEIDKILYDGAGTDGAAGWCFDMFTYNGVSYLNVASPGFSIGFLYCFETKTWNESGFPSGMRLSNNAYAVNNQLTGGIKYVLDQTTPVYQDNSVAFTMTIQTELKSFNNGLPFIIKNINLLADTQSSGSTTLSTSANDYTSFGTVGSFDLTQVQKNLPGGGYYDSSVAFKLTDAGNNAWRGQALVVDWMPA